MTMHPTRIAWLSAYAGTMADSTLPKAAICAATMNNEKNTDSTITTKRGPSPKRMPK